MLNNIEITYETVDLEHVYDNATQMNDEEKNQLLGIIQVFEKCFDGTLGDWYSDPVNIELKPDYKMFNCKY